MLLRHSRVPLQELCLQTKLLAPRDVIIADFLAKAPEPPRTPLVKNAVDLLKVGHCLSLYLTRSVPPLQKRINSFTVFAGFVLCIVLRWRFTLALQVLPG